MSREAPKLEWTGERYLPWLRNATMAYEHMHRYAFAAQYAKGKQVLDLGSGEGYGSNILAGTATSVLGVDIDERAIQHASSKYRKANLEFGTGSFAQVPVSRNCSFDLVVCFEAIEHTRNHDELLREVKRLLRPDGLFMVSTPNKTAYHREFEGDNPYHVSELEPEEFETLLRRYFRESRFLGQRTHPGSSIWPLGASDSGSVEEFAMERGAAEFEFIANEKRVPVYIVALASDSTDALEPAGSVLIDSSNELLVETRTSSATMARIQKDLEYQLQKLSNVEQSVARLISDLQATQHWLSGTQKELTAVYASHSWQFLNALRRIRNGILPQGSIRRTMLQRLLSLIAPGSK